jgi:hypothetical protein
MLKDVTQDIQALCQVEYTAENRLHYDTIGDTGAFLMKQGKDGGRVLGKDGPVK